MDLIILIPLIISFLLTLVFLPKWIKKCQQVDLVWEDMNKYQHPKNVAASGGIVVVMAFLISVLVYLALGTFLFNNLVNVAEIFALLSVILILAIVGLVDDLLGWKHGGLSWRFRIFLAFVSSIPLVVINAGQQTIGLPFFGAIELGLIYPLILIPLGIAGATTTYNFLAGFNGLEAGQGIIILSFLSFVAYLTGNSWLSIIGLIMVLSLIVFYYYNRVPAKVFPGDIMTWAIGSLIAGMAILGNFEKIAVFVFALYIIEFILKSRGGFSPAKQSFGIPNRDNSLEMPYDGKIYSLTHLAIGILKKFKKKVYEKDVTYFIFLIQIIICLATLIIFKSSLFV